MTRQTFQVALLVSTDNDYDRKIISGVSRYGREAGNWMIFREDEHLHKMPPLGGWQGHGVIAQLENPAVHRSIARLRIPVVGVASLANLSPALDKIVCVSTDNQRIAQRAAEHLLECGLDNFAYCGVPATPRNGWSKERGRAFSDFLTRAGYRCAMYTGRRRTARQWEALQSQMAAWLQSLKLPVGVMACDDPRARHVLEACRRLGLRVPEDVAVLGVDNDELICELCHPPLSSIETGIREVGYEAAAALDRLLAGKQPQRMRTLVAPGKLVARRSTDILTAPHEGVAAALRFIRDHAAEPIQVLDVARHVGVSRSTLDNHFRAVMGRTTHDEIERVRLNIARSLLENTDWPLRTIAAKSGYRNEQYMCKVLRRALGRTPGQHRQVSRTRRAPKPMTSRR